MNTLSEVKTLLEDYLKGRGLSEHTVRRRLVEFTRFEKWCAKNHLTDYRETQSKDIEAYFLYLREKPYSRTTMEASRSMLKELFLVLKDTGRILENPMKRTEVYIREKNGVKELLDEQEVKQFLEAISPKLGEGLRDRALFELLYVTAMRIGEVYQLNVEDIDFSSDEVLIRAGKNRKERVVPLGRVAKEYLTQWVQTARSWFLTGTDESALFLSRRGVRLPQSTIRGRMKLYLKKADIYRPGITVHSLRHSAASHMLGHGADVRYVQELLGHESIETTVLYTHQVIEQLKKTHRMYHPRENELSDL